MKEKLRETKCANKNIKKAQKKSLGKYRYKIFFICLNQIVDKHLDEFLSPVLHVAAASLLQEVFHLFLHVQLLETLHIHIVLPNLIFSWLQPFLNPVTRQLGRLLNLQHKLQFWLYLVCEKGSVGV